ncbi:hypothetical protein Leryth_012736 [Lithospermum erythrorhizon]|nr:hypothetical protein Leryth_012736 [Lithospermum erythrorhizon]
MESHNVVRERVNILAAHLGAASEDISATATHVFPMSCVNSIDSVVRRYDNRLQFARQGSSYQSSFMRHMSDKQQSFINDVDYGIRRRDNRLQFARQGSYYQAAFMRQMSARKGSDSLPDMPLESPDRANNTSASSETPNISRPKQDSNVQNVFELRSLEQSCRYNEEVLRSPNFAKPKQTLKNSQSCSDESAPTMKSSGSVSSPRMDVTESGHSYVVAVELPGVSIDDLRVEVSDKNLIVSGKRSAHWSKVANVSNDSISVFHRREILQGPYRTVWSLPTNADKERVSAEYSEGLLRIRIPKLCGATTALKANI